MPMSIPIVASGCSFTEGLIMLQSTFDDDKCFFRLLLRNPTPRIEKQVTDALKTVERDGNLTNEMKKMLTPRQSSSTQIYGLPKIHKEGLPLHTIVCTIGSPMGLPRS